MDVPKTTHKMDGLASHAHQDMYQVLTEDNVSQHLAKEKTKLLVKLEHAMLVLHARLDG